MKQPARVMIDGYNLAMPRGTGVSTYGYQLAATLGNMGIAVDGLYGLRMGFARKLREIMFFESLAHEHLTRTPRQGGWRWMGELGGGILPPRARLVPRTGRVITANFSNRLPDYGRLFSIPDLFERANRHFKRFRTFLTVSVPNPPEIMHWTYPVPVRLAGAKNIYTLHDLVPLKLPFASGDNKRHYFRLIRETVRSADHLVTVSDASAADIKDLFKFRHAKLTNTFQAVRLPSAVTAETEDEVAQTVKGVFNLPHRGYFLFFGAIEPKKNVGRLLEAYLSLGTETQLVIVGTKSYNSDEELRLLQRDETAPLRANFRRVRRLDYLPRSLLMRLVRGARAVVFPSLYEGFGLPVLEAMLVGTPVLTARNSSLTEVAGDAALFVDPYSVPSIAAGLRALDTDAELRARLAAAGPAQAARFSVDAYQARLAAMYADVLGGSRGAR